MDYQVFLVRPCGHGGRLVKGGTRILKVLAHGISISPALLSHSGASAEYQFESISNVRPSTEDDHEFKFDVINSHGMKDTIKFSCDSRSALLTAILNKLDDIESSGIDFPLKKHSHKRGGLVDTVLRVRSASIVKMINTGVRQERRKINPSKRMNFIDILKVEVLTDDEHVLLLYFKSRILRLSLKDISPFVESLQQNMKSFLNKHMEILKITSSMMVDNISAFVRKTAGSHSLYSFEVEKKIDAKKEDRHRVVSITKEHLVEKSGDNVIAVYSLEDMVGAIVKDDSSKEVVLEFKSWRPVQYFIEARNDFLASIADVMESLKLFSFSIHSEQFLSHTFPERPHPFYQNECEQYYCSQLLATVDMNDLDHLHNVLREYACNINVGDSQCSDPRVLKKVLDVLKNSGGNIHLSTCCCLVIQRLLASRVCFDAVKSMPEFSSVLLQCLRSGNAVSSYVATVCIRAAMRMATEGPVSESVLLSKLTNKVLVLSTENMQQLDSLLHTFSLADDTTLQVYGILQILLVAASSLPQESDNGRGWPKSFEACIMGVTDVFCRLSRSPKIVVYRSNSLLMKALLMHSSPSVASQLQKICLDRGVILIHMKEAIFGTDEETRALSGNLVFLMFEGNKASKKLLETLLPKGIMQFYHARTNQLNSLKEESSSRSIAWMEILELIRKGNYETPILLWNDAKRLELKEFLKDHVEAFFAVADNNKDIVLNSSEMQLNYSTAKAGAATVVDGVHLELLVEKHPAQNDPMIIFWKLNDPVSTFQTVLQAMVLGFTPLFGQMNLPEVDLRLAANALTWIYEKYMEDIQRCLEKLNVIEIIVGMLREVIDSEHQVFVFKLVVFLLSTVEIGGKLNALRFLRASGATVLVPLIVLSLSKCCRDKYTFECDAWNTRDSRYLRVNETVLVKHLDGRVKSVRVPSGRFYEVLDKAVQDGSLDAKEGVHWQHETVHEKLQLGLALDLLEAIMRVSGIDSNIEEFPPPAACSHLSKEELLCHIVQILLWAKGSVFGRILDILAYIVKVDSAAMKRLYKLGAFEILLWKLLAGDIADTDKFSIVGFIRQSHMLQDPDSVLNGSDYLKSEGQFPWHSSVLRLFLPDGLILKLMSEESDTFTTIIQTEHQTPEVIWTAEMRERLLDYLKSELEPYVKFRASDPLALYIHVPKAPLEYSELSESMFSAPFYLDNLLDTERFPNYQINDPVSFLNSLTLDLRRYSTDLTPTPSSTAFWTKELPHIHLLLCAQAYLVQRFPQLLLSNDMDSVVIMLASPAFEICSSQSDNAPPEAVDILMQSTIILRHCCKAPAREVDVVQASLDFSLNILSLAENMDCDESYAHDNSKFEAAIGGALLLLGAIASLRTGREQSWENTKWRRRMWFILVSAAADAVARPPRGPSPISFAALSCLKYFAEDETYCYQVLEQGWYLPLLLLAIPSADITLKAHDSKSALFYSSADVLASLVQSLIDTDKQSQVQRKKSIYGIISRLIPPPLLQCLLHAEGPEKFISAVCSEFMHPEGIWTHDMRAELLQSVEDRLQYHNSVLESDSYVSADNDIDWLEGFNYECLNGEVRAEGLFVRGMSNTSWEGFILPPGHSYIDVMQDYLQLNAASLLIREDIQVESISDGCDDTLNVRKIIETRENPDHLEKIVENETADDVEQLTNEIIGKVEKLPDLEEKDELSNLQHLVKNDIIISPQSKQLENCLYTLSALRECLKHAVKEGRDDILVNFRHSLISEIVFSGRSCPEVQIELAAIVKALAESKAGLDIVLNSELMQCLALQLWKAATRDSRYHNHQVLMSTLEAVLLLAENISATVKATNFFSGHGLFLPVLAIFSKLNTPDLSHEKQSDLADMISVKITKAEQLLAGEIVGQLLLAGSGISRRTKLAKDLTFWRTGSIASDFRHVSHGESIEEATDMYELYDIIEQNVEDGVDPVVLKTLVLLFPIDFLTLLAREPSKACDLFERQSWSPMLVWDEGSKRHLKARLNGELLRLRDSFLNEGLSTIPTWSMTQGPPVFLRWTLATVLDNDTRPLYKDTEDVDYCSELYLGGFFIDQFLRNPEFDFGIALEERFLREIRKAIVVGAIPRKDGIHELDFDDRRRLLLSLILLFKLRPQLLLRHSNFDIFFPIFDFISGGSSRERRGLTQVAIVLFHCIATHSDIADCMSSEDLMGTLVTLLDLKVPASVADFTGTDPRLCSLMLMLRLVRLSSTAVEVALRIGVVSKLAMLADKSTDMNLRQRAVDCLAVMCADKRNGAEVHKLLDKLTPKERKALVAWNQPTSDIRDEIVDSKTLKHFLQQRYPSSWWVSDSSDAFSESDTEFSGSITVVEASLTFPGPNLS